MTKNDNKIILAHYWEAIKLRYEGKTSAKIKDVILEKYDIDVHSGTIRNWFMRNGALRELYDNYAEERIELEKKEAQNFLKGNVTKAAKTLAMVMAGKGGPAQVMAAKEFLERGLGKVKENIDLNQNVAFLDIMRLIDDNNKNRQQENKGNDRESDK